MEHALPPVSSQAIDVSVIIVNYNVREFLLQAVASVHRAMDGLRVEMIVVDNDSVDGSVEAIRRQYPDVRIIENHRNIGFGAANNQAIREAAGEFLLILNPDTIIQEDTLEKLVGFMRRHPDAGAAGCKILNPDGTFARESRRAFPTPRVAFYRISGLSRLFPGSPRFGQYNLTYLPIEETAEVDALSGSCMMLRRRALCTSFADHGSGNPKDRLPLVRLFDEEFFMYGEDLDLCYRIQAAGWKIYYAPETQIIHYKGESTRKGDLRYVKLFYGAMLLFAEKHFAGRSTTLRFGLRLAIVVRAGVSALRRALRRATFPVMDFVMVYGSVVAVAALWPGTAGRALTPIFLLTTPLIYALSTVVQTRLAGGYERTRQRLRPALAGLLGSFAFMAALSFFVKAIAFSRLVIVVSLLPAALLLLGWRLARGLRMRELRRAVVVGSLDEAVKLDGAVSTHYQPPFVIAGCVSPDDRQPPEPSAPIHRLGSAGQLRDIVRVHAIDDIIFATNGLSNRTVLSLMHSLRDLPVEFKTLVADGTHVIGKTRVEDLSIPVVPAEATHGKPPGVGQRLAEIGMAIVGTLVWPIVELLAVLARRPGLLNLRGRLRMMPSVLTGRRGLVGYLPHDRFVPPPEWQIEEGLFSVSETLSITNPGPDELERAWLFYIHNRSISLDVDIIVRSVRQWPGPVK